MSATFSWSGGTPEQSKNAVRDGVVHGMVGVALVMQKLMRERLSQPGAGRRYRVTKSIRRKGRNLRAKGWHVASLPGRPPAALNGSLRASWTLVPQGRIGAATTKDQGFAYIDENRGKSIMYVLGTNLVYARALEYGHGRVAARPYVRPVMDAVKPEVAGIMRLMMAKTLRSKR